MPAEKPSIPVPALVLGLGGLIPFLSTALLIWIDLPVEQWLPEWLVRERDKSELAMLALGAYGAVILSFLGGIRWGNLLFDHASLSNWMPLLLSVLPSLIAWSALLLSPRPMMIVLAAGFTFQYALDVSAAKRGEIPQWFLRLRLILTSGAVLSLIVGMLGVSSR